MSKESQLSTRSDAKELAASSGGAPLFFSVLDTDSQADAWRIVEAFSLDGAPFELEIAWSCGAGSGAKAKFTVARATRVAIFARGLRIRAANLSSTRNRVGVNVADGFAPARNVFEVRNTTLDQNQETSVEIPAFAESFIVELADPLSLSSIEVRLYDGQDVLRAKYAGDIQLATSISVGGAGRVAVASPTCIDFRVVFQLSL